MEKAKPFSATVASIADNGCMAIYMAKARCPFQTEPSTEEISKTAPLVAMGQPPRDPLFVTATLQTLTWSRGVYEGEVEDGYPHGHGRLTSEALGIEYVGNWYRGQKHGAGKMTITRDACTTTYTGTPHVRGQTSSSSGEWLEDKQHGNGCVVYPSGNRYEGNWSHGKKNGRGVMEWWTSTAKHPMNSCLPGTTGGKDTMENGTTIECTDMAFTFGWSQVWRMAHAISYNITGGLSLTVGQDCGVATKEHSSTVVVTVMVV